MPDVDPTPASPSSRAESSPAGEGTSISHSSFARSSLRSYAGELAKIQRQVEDLSAQYGLDTFPVVFEVVSANDLNAIAAYGGFPTRYPHWRFGQEYNQLKKGYDYGLQKIYELVINNDPCYAYLLASNQMTDQKLVMAHVYGHCDFFKNNAYFAHTDRHMIDKMGNHASRIKGIMERHGVDEVEAFIDCCLSLEDLVDIHAAGIKRGPERPVQRIGASEEDPPLVPARFDSKGYMDAWINPAEVIASELKVREAQQKKGEGKFPERPVRDVLQFLIEHAPLKAWQQEVMSIVREEALYFAPQGQTKIMNEGWATYWHSTMMTRHLADASEIVCFCDHHSGTVATQNKRLNPYKLGLELFRDIERRWNTGKFGIEYDQCDDWAERKNWFKDTGLGRQKIFDVRRIHNDVTFLDEFLTPEFCLDQKLFSFAYNKDDEQFEIESREFKQIKRQLLSSLENLGRPVIDVIDSNHANRNELVLQHRYSGAELKTDYAQGALENLYRIWTRPVHIETTLEDKPVVLSFDGKNFKQSARK